MLLASRCAPRRSAGVRFFHASVSALAACCVIVSGCGGSSQPSQPAPLSISPSGTISSAIVAIMKPADPSAVIGAKLMEVFQEVGLPPGVVGRCGCH